MSNVIRGPWPPKPHHAVEIPAQIDYELIGDAHVVVYVFGVPVKVVEIEPGTWTGRPVAEVIELNARR